MYWWHHGFHEPETDVKLEWPLLRRVFSYFIPYWALALVVLLCIGVAAALGLVPALVTQHLINYLTGRPGQFSFVALLIGLLVGSSLLGGLIGVVQSYFSNRISQSIMFDLRNQLFDRVLKQSIAFFTATRTGDVMSRLSNDVNGVQSVVSDTIFSLVNNLVILVSTVVLMFALDWKLTIAALLVLPAFLLPTRRVGKATFQARKATQGKLAEMTAYMQETLGISGMQLVKAFVKQTAETLRFRQLNDELRTLNIRQSMIGRWFFMLMGVLGTAGPAVLWLFGGYLVVTGQESLGTVVTFATVLLARLYGPVGSLANMQVNVVGSLALFQRIFEYMDLPVEIDEKPDGARLDQARGEVEFEHVTFRYPSGDRPALKEVSFRIEPGQLAAIVGPTGAGKTTVTSLLPRFYDPQLGAVRLDGYDVRDLTLESMGRQIGMVFQDTFLFHATIRENLLYAKPAATEAEMIAAAKAAYIHDFIESLPEGYDTVVGERGHRLSGGEKQRVAIARVILKDPRVLILDEATSNLDSESEHLIQVALRPLFEGRTSLVIAHRLSTILAADVILVMDRGELVEQGRHAELLKQDGLYARLYHRQFEAAVELATPA
ncbi:MAG: ABC transporter ATP-binding protein [Chloroflexi bacterium]|nr:MAG: ABC transporter ATP-binding protein [Chloroflexota bacterium]